MKLESQLQLTKEYHGVEIKKENIDELYNRLVNSESLQKAFLEKRYDKLNQRKRKKEIAKVFFNTINHDPQETKRNLISIVYNHLKDLELESSDLKNKHVLNIGSNMPIFDEYLRIAYDSDVVSLDFDVDDKNTSFPGAQGKYVFGDARMMPFKEESFDVALSHASMPHILVQERGENETELDFLKENYDTEMIEDEVMAVLEETYSCLKPGGQIKFSTLPKDLYLKEETELDFDEDGHVDIEKANAWENKRVTIIEKVLKKFEDEKKCIVIYKVDSNGLIIIRKPKIV